MEPRCPTRNSPAPHLHPAMQFEGEVQPCSDPWHRQITPQNREPFEWNESPMDAQDE